MERLSDGAGCCWRRIDREENRVLLTEAQWTVCPYPETLLNHVSRQLSGRKVRLYAVACARRIDHLLTDAMCRHGVKVAEHFAEGLADDHERCYVEAALEVLCDTAPAGMAQVPFKVAHHRNHRTPYHAANWTEHWAAKVGRPASGRQHADLLRHIAGNPFRPARRGELPSAVVQLAQAIYAGADCGFALHDALLDAGRADLAEHFREPEEHPKGCWAIDLILGKS